MRKIAVLEPLTVALYRRLWIASVIFGVGHTVQLVAANWLMLELTGSPLWVGLMVASPHLPLLILAVPSGAMSDTVDRRFVLVASSALMAVAMVGMSGLFLLDLLTPPRLLALGITVGIGFAFYVPAWTATVPDVVPREMLDRAISVNSGSGAIAMAVGPALGGVLVAVYGFVVPFLVAVVGYLVLVTTVAAVRGVRWRDDDGDLGPAMATGLRYMRFSGRYRWILIVTGAFGATSAALRAMLPNVTSDRLLAGAEIYGFLLGAMGLGALVAALTKDRGMAALGDRLVPGAIALYGLAGIVVGVSGSVTLTAIAMGFAGLGWTWTLTSLNAKIHLLAPAWVRGRAMSFYVLALFGLVPPGTVLAGVLGDRFGAPTALIVLSLSVVALALTVHRRPLPEPRAWPSPDPVGDLPREDHPEFGATGRVMVTTVWDVADERIRDFLDMADELRRVRMRTGAFRWDIYRDVMRPNLFTEVFEIHSWQQHLQQHERMDLLALDGIHRAVDFDRSRAPRNAHLISVDRDSLADPIWTGLESDKHGQLHRRDGSVPMDDGTDVTRARRARSPDPER